MFDMQCCGAPVSALQTSYQSRTCDKVDAPRTLADVRRVSLLAQLLAAVRVAASSQHRLLERRLLGHLRFRLGRRLATTEILESACTYAIELYFLNAVADDSDLRGTVVGKGERCAREKWCGGWALRAVTTTSGEWAKM